MGWLVLMLKLFVRLFVRGLTPRPSAVGLSRFFLWIGKKTGHELCPALAVVRTTSGHMSGVSSGNQLHSESTRRHSPVLWGSDWAGVAAALSTYA